MATKEEEDEDEKEEEEEEEGWKRSEGRISGHEAIVGGKEGLVMGGEDRRGKREEKT